MSTKTNKKVIVASVGILMIFILGVGLVAAQETTSNYFWDWLVHFFGGTPTTFSVVGDSRGCTLNSVHYETLSNGQSAIASASTYCTGSMTHGLFDTYKSSTGPYIEYKDNLNFYCNDQNGCSWDLYCCENEPNSQDDCDAGEVFTSKDCRACTSSIWTRFPCPTPTAYQCPSAITAGLWEQSILYSQDHYNVCNPGTAKLCYYKTIPHPTECTARPYLTLPNNDCSTQTYQSYQLYNSNQECLDGAVTPTQTCSQLNGHICSGSTPTCNGNLVPSSDGMCCTGTCTGSCPSGYELCSSGVCKITGTCNLCTQNCAGKQCGYDGCGGTCGTCSSPQTCNSNYQCTSPSQCGNGVCDSGEATSCPQDCSIPGEQSGRTWITNVQVQKGINLASETKLIVTLRNDGEAEELVKLEGGFYTYEYAKNTADLFSIFPTYSGNLVPSCNTKENFVQTKEVTVAPGETVYVELSGFPINAFSQYNPGKYSVKDSPPVAFVGEFKQCFNPNNTALNGYRNDYGDVGVLWKSGGKGTYYYQSLTGLETCPFFKANILCGNAISGTCSLNTLTINQKCDVGIFWQETSDSSEAEVSAEFKKMPITLDNAKTSTAQQLAASSCVLDSDCLILPNKTSSCIIFSELKKQGILTDDQIQSSFDTLGSSINNGVIGAAGGIAACFIGAGLSAASIAGGITAGAAVITVPATVGACAAAGALIGIGGTVAVHELTSYIIPSSSDKFLSATGARNADMVGICIQKDKTTTIGSFISNIGNTFKITGDASTDGLILIGGAILLIIIFLRIMSK